MIFLRISLNIDYSCTVNRESLFKKTNFFKYTCTGFWPNFVHTIRKKWHVKCTVLTRNVLIQHCWYRTWIWLCFFGNTISVWKFEGKTISVSNMAKKNSENTLYLKKNCFYRKKMSWKFFPLRYGENCFMTENLYF